MKRIPLIYIYIYISGDYSKRNSLYLHIYITYWWRKLLALIDLAWVMAFNCGGFINDRLVFIIEEALLHYLNSYQLITGHC